MILVTGASGRIGTAVLRDLADRALAVRALSRPRSRSPMRDHPGVEWLEGDLADERSVEAALRGVQTVVLHSSPAPSQVAQQERVIDAAIRAGVRRIVKLSAAGASADAACDAARWHWRIEERLADRDAETIVARTTRPMQDLLQQVPLLVTSGLLVGCQGTGQVADVDARDIGAVLATLARARYGGFADRSARRAVCSRARHGGAAHRSRTATLRSFRQRARVVTPLRERPRTHGSVRGRGGLTLIPREK